MEATNTEDYVTGMEQVNEAEPPVELDGTLNSDAATEENIDVGEEANEIVEDVAAPPAAVLPPPPPPPPPPRVLSTAAPSSSSSSSSSSSAPAAGSASTDEGLNLSANALLSQMNKLNKVTMLTDVERAERIEKNSLTGELKSVLLKYVVDEEDVFRW